MATTPGAQLLRSSRLFSIPEPLPRPPPLGDGGRVYDSPTATFIHPTHQAITTSRLHQKRGEYGLKRTMPMGQLKKQAIPMIGLKKLDAYEKITEFRGVSSYYWSLRKWQEMDIPLVRKVPKFSNDSYLPMIRRAPPVAPASVFESKYDELVDKSRERDDRWSFKGPWVGSISEAEFVTFLERMVRPRRDEFRKYLRKECAKAMSESQGQEVTAHDVPEADFVRFIKALREDKRELYNHIRVFFDLPPFRPRQSDSSHIMSIVADETLGDTARKSIETTSESPYAIHGPPIMHPSAGLYYTRTKATLHNDALRGPQLYPPPVKARVVYNNPIHSKARLIGVGGFLIPEADKQGHNLDFEMKFMGPRSDLDLETRGGNKVEAQPLHAEIAADGRIKMGAIPARIYTPESNRQLIKAQGRQRASAQRGPTPNFKSISLGSYDGHGYGTAR